MYTVYKITNNVNQKIYIGATRLSIEERWELHVSAAKSNKNTMRLYNAIRKYGKDSFIIESIDTSAKNEIELDKLETKYIVELDARNPDKGYNFLINNYCIRNINPKTGITHVDVEEIRKLYSQCTYGPKYWWKRLYQNKLSYSGFEKIWQGTSWKHIMPEVFTKERRNYYKTHQFASRGENNNNSIFSDEEVLLIRKKFVTYSAEDIHIDFKNRCALSTFKSIVFGNSYKHIPVYKKNKKQWYLNGEIINIEQYNPVSTISESGE